METTLTLSHIRTDDFAGGSTVTVTGLAPGSMANGAMVPGSHLSLTFLNPPPDQAALFKTGTAVTVSLAVALAEAKA